MTEATQKPPRKAPTRKQKVAGTMAVSEAKPDALRSKAEAEPATVAPITPRLSGRAYAARNHAAYMLAHPGIRSLPAPAHKPKGRSVRGWTEPSPHKARAKA
jgi:hypothetical protein